MKNILAAFTLTFFSQFAFANGSCLTQAIEAATEQFKSKNIEVISGPKISAEYGNRNIYYINFEYQVRAGDDVTEKTTSYWAFSDYNEWFKPLNACVIGSVLEQ